MTTMLTSQSVYKLPVSLSLLLPSKMLNIHHHEYKDGQFPQYHNYDLYNNHVLMYLLVQ